MQAPIAWLAEHCCTAETEVSFQGPWQYSNMPLALAVVVAIVKAKPTLEGVMSSTTTCPPSHSYESSCKGRIHGATEESQKGRAFVWKRFGQGLLPKGFLHKVGLLSEVALQPVIRIQNRISRPRHNLDEIANMEKGSGSHAILSDLTGAVLLLAVIHSLEALPITISEATVVPEDKCGPVESLAPLQACKALRLAFCHSLCDALWKVCCNSNNSPGPSLWVSPSRPDECGGPRQQRSELLVRCPDDNSASTSTVAKNMTGKHSVTSVPPKMTPLPRGSGAHKKMQGLRSPNFSY